MKSSATIVTALYNIGRDNLQGKNAHRSFSKYLNWFQHLLSINAPMVIFIPDELHSYVQEHRNPAYDTKIITRNFEDLAAYQYHDRIQATIDAMVKESNSNGQIPRYFAECPEFITAKYEVIIYSKFDFLHEVAAENPYNTDHFIWMDAGTFYQEPPFNCSLPWPDPYKIQLLSDKFLVSSYRFNVSDKSPLNDKRSYLRRNQNEICAYILGGSKAAIDKIHTDFWKAIHDALDMGVINNEQHILQLMVLEQPQDYYIWGNSSRRYPNLPIPLKDRMIPAELAQGTFMPENYPINPNVRLITVATKEVVSSSYARWEATAKYYGYNYDIVGRDESWGGFGTKLRLYHRQLLATSETYAILTDCTDVFFCASSTEAYDKFIASGHNIIVGGEGVMYYPNGHYDKHTIKQFFDSIKKSPQAYPNSGFIMGKTETLIELMKYKFDYKDDQAACFDNMYEHQVDMTVDYDTTLIGNVPMYQNEELSRGYYEFDPITKRYRNKMSGEMPVALHFPGKNFHTMGEFFGISQSDLISSDDTSGAIWVFVGVIVLIAFIALVMYFLTQR